MGALYVLRGFFLWHFTLKLWLKSVALSVISFVSKQKDATLIANANKYKLFYLLL